MTTGLWRAEVTRIKADRPYVKIPRLTGNLEYGPLDSLEGVFTLEGVETENTGGLDFGAHAHALFAGGSRALVAGDRVIVGFLEGRVDDPVLLGRLV